MADFASTLLKVALDAAGFIPGLSQFKSAIAIAQDVEPALVAAVEGTKAFLSTEQGQKAIRDLGTVLGAQGKIAHDPSTGTLTITSDALKGDANTPSDSTFYGN